MTKQGPAYRGERYWENEKPEEVWTARAVIAHYPKAGKLQIAATYKDPESGALRRAKVVTLDQEDLQLHPEALALLARVVEEWRP